MILIFIAVLLLWATYNWVRFAGKERRSAPVSVNEEQLAVSFKVNPVDILNMQQVLFLEDLEKTLQYFEDKISQKEFDDWMKLFS